MELTKNELAALQYAEKYGIIEYDVQGHTMTYTESFPTEGSYYVEVDLNAGKEKGRTKQ